MLDDECDKEEQRKGNEKVTVLHSRNYRIRMMVMLIIYSALGTI